MPDRFTSALLAALNDSAVVKESDWDSIAEVLRVPADPIDIEAPSEGSPDPENRFAATVSCFMAKVRSGG